MTMEGICFAAEAGMPQLDPKYWYSQAFWLITVLLFYIFLFLIFLFQNQKNLDDRK